MSERGRRDSNDPLAPRPLPGANGRGPHGPQEAPHEIAAGSSGEAVSSSVPPMSDPRSDPRERRTYERFEVTWSVDCVTEDTFLYASIGNISEMGIFVQTVEPLPVGMQLTLRFAPPNSLEPFVLRGTVQWVNTIRPLSDNPNPGMGIRFMDLSSDDRERIVETIRTIAYLRDNPPLD